MLFGFDKETQHLINVLRTNLKVRQQITSDLRNRCATHTHWQVINFAVSFKTDVKDINSLATDIRFYENAIIYNFTMITKHQKEIKLFEHVPVRPLWKLKIFFFHYLQWHDWSGLAFLSWFWQFTWDQLLWFPVASQQIPIGSTFATFVKSWDVFHKEITFCF